MWNKSVCKPLRNSEGRREKWIRAAGVAPKKRANVCLSVSSVPHEKKRKKKERNAFFFVEFTETTFRNLFVSKVVEHRFVRCFKTHARGEIDYEEIYL
jgi:hypothetical protein